jgi:hypothetical protein
MIAHAVPPRAQHQPSKDSVLCVRQKLGSVQSFEKDPADIR